MAVEIIVAVMAILGIYEGIRLLNAVMLFSDPVGPGWYLLFISCLLFICAIALMVRKFIRRKAGQREGSLSLHKGPAGRALFFMLLYGIAAMFLGYVPASAIFFILIQRIFGEQSWARCAVVGVSITGCFYFVFSYLAHMPLP